MSGPVLRITDRLRGIYTVAVNDGAGLLNGKDTFTRHFETTPIQKEAADVIEALETALRDARNYVDAVVANASGNAKRTNYLGCVCRIDAALAKLKGDVTGE